MGSLEYSRACSNDASDYDEFSEADDDVDYQRALARRRRANRFRARQQRREPRLASHRELARARRPDQDVFRCRNCRAVIGPTVSGGRYRNHCPLCLHSLHVDDRRPGDRASTCRSKMVPVGAFARPSGEQVIVHRCLGCGLERYNRVAADDNPLALMKLPLVEPRSNVRRSRDTASWA